MKLPRLYLEINDRMFSFDFDKSTGYYEIGSFFFSSSNVFERTREKADWMKRSMVQFALTETKKNLS